MDFIDDSEGKDKAIVPMSDEARERLDAIDDVIIESEDELTVRQKVFFESYMRTFNQARSAEVAGYSRGAGRRLAKRMSKIINDRLNENSMEGVEIVKRMVDIARGLGAEDIDVFGFVNFEKLKEDGRTHIIKKITRTRDAISVEVYDSQRALEILGRSQELFREKEIDWRGVIEIPALEKMMNEVFGNRENEVVEIIDAEVRDQ